jgi:uncharacterized protein
MYIRYLILGLCVCLITPILYADRDPYAPDSGTVILNSVPDVRQSTDYSCGASALQAVLSYWGIDSREGSLIKELNSSPETGTTPGSILDVASSRGLNAFIFENMSVDNLRMYTQEGIPVIVTAQAWNGDYDTDGTWVTKIPDSWENFWEDGHYMVVIGVDSSNVYLEDPSLLGTRGVIPIKEFITRWHDYEGGSGPSDPKVIHAQMGIIIKGNEPARYPMYTRVT